MVLSVPVIFTGFALASRALDTCVKLLQWPIIILGILILVVAVTGFVGGFWRIRWLMFFYFVAMLIAIILLAGLIVFVYMITNKGSGHPVPNRAFLEYQLDDYSGWLRRRVVNPFRWDHIKGCLNTTTMCAGLNQRYRFAQDFFDAQISPIQVKANVGFDVMEMLPLGPVYNTLHLRCSVMTLRMPIITRSNLYITSPCVILWHVPVSGFNIGNASCQSLVLIFELYP